MVASLERSEQNREIERDEQRFKDMVFAMNPELYFQMWPEQGQGISEEEEEDMDWLVPETEGDVQAMMAELRKAGWAG